MQTDTPQPVPESPVPDETPVPVEDTAPAPAAEAPAAPEPEPEAPAPAAEAAPAAAPTPAPAPRGDRPPRDPRPDRQQQREGRGDRPPRERQGGGGAPNPNDRQKGGGDRRGPDPRAGGGDRRGDAPRGDRRPDPRRPEGPVEIEYDKLISDSLYLDNQAHVLVARLRDLDAGTRSQLRRLYGAVRRACRAPEADRQHQFVMLRARLAYTIARHGLRSLDPLEKLLLQVTRRNESRGYDRFRDLFEAIIAYNE